MKMILLIFIILVGFVLVGFVVLGQKSRSDEAPGLSNAKLARCPASPNCVCSEFASDEHFIEPIRLTDARDSMNMHHDIKSIIQTMGGQIRQEQEAYIAVEFSSTIFRFVDDMELRLDADENLLHLRSASRIGRSDLGVNKKRMERFRALFAERVKP